MFTALYLHDNSFKWVQLHLKDFLKCTEDTWEVKSQTIFNMFLRFKKSICKIFTNINAERTAERTLISLQQENSAITYVIKFQKVTISTNWEDISLTAQFYKELKNAVKNNLIREDWPESLSDMIDAAVYINNRQYK